VAANALGQEAAALRGLSKLGSKLETLQNTVTDENTHARSSAER